MDTNEEVIIIQNTEPRSIGEVLVVWSELFSMTEEFFAAELPRSSKKNTTLALLLFTPLIAFLHAISDLISAANQPYYTVTSTFTFIDFLISFGQSLILIPAGFYLFNSVFFASAKLFDGKGKFNDQAYLTSLFFMPFALITTILSLLSFMPFASFISLGLGIFQIIIQIRAFIVVHKLTYVKSSEAVVIPYVFIVIIVILIITFTNNATLF